MAALTANIDLVEQEGKLLDMPVVASDILYKGALVKINAAGYLAPASAEAGSTFAGVMYEKVDNSAGSAGDLSGRVISEEGRCFELTGTGFAQSNVGDTVYATDDQTVTLTEGTDSKPIVGKIKKFISSTKVLVAITPFAGTGASA